MKYDSARVACREEQQNRFGAVMGCVGLVFKLFKADNGDRTSETQSTELWQTERRIAN